jgi:hypothetical protein
MGIDLLLAFRLQIINELLAVVFRQAFLLPE